MLFQNNIRGWETLHTCLKSIAFSWQGCILGWLPRIGESGARLLCWVAVVCSRTQSLPFYQLVFFPFSFFFFLLKVCSARRCRLPRLPVKSQKTQRQSRSLLLSTVASETSEDSNLGHFIGCTVHSWQALRMCSSRTHRLPSLFKRIDTHSKCRNKWPCGFCGDIFKDQKVGSTCYSQMKCSSQVQL